MPLVLMIFALMSILPAAMIPSAIAQEEDDTSLDDEENLASGIVSDVLDGSGNAEDENDQDAANTASEDSSQEQGVDEDNVGEFGDDEADLDDANVAVPLGIPVNVQLEEEVVVEPEPDNGELPPEDEDVFFCLEDIDFGVLCFNTLDECEFVEDLFSGFIISDCDEFETPPSGAAICRVVDGNFALGDCVPFQPL